MFYFLFAFILILSFIFKKNKLIFLILLLFMWLSFGWSDKNADREIYQGRYDNYKELSTLTEPLFTFLMKISHFFKIDYPQFLIIISFVCIFLMTLFVKKMKVKYILIPFALFLIYPFILSVVILRYTISASIIIYGFSFILKDGKKWWLKYIFCVILASLIHFASIYFLLFLLVPKDIPNKKIILYSFIFFIAAFGATYFTQNVINENFGFLSEKLSGVTDEVDDMGKTSFNYYFGTILRTLVAIGSFVIIYKYFYNSKQYTNNENIIINRTLKANYLFLSSIGLYFISVDFSRLLFPMLFLNYSVFAIIISRRRNKALPLFIMIIVCFLELYMLILRYDFMIENVFNPFFLDNHILS